MKYFRAKNPPVVGLDISSTAIKLLQLAKDGDGYRVEHFAIEALPDGAVADKSIEDVDAVATAIERAVKMAGTRAKHCAIAVSGSAVMTKTISLPSDLSGDDLEGQVELEANQYIPYPLEEVSLDFEVLGRSERNPELSDILLAACKTENVELRREAVEAAGLKAYVVDVEAYAIANAFSLVRDPKRVGARETVAVVDVGAHMTTLVIFRGGRVRYSREHPFGGRQLVDEIQRRYGMSREEATFFERGEAPPEHFEEEVLEPFEQNVVQHISRSLQFYASSSDYSNVDSLYLAGGCARLPGIDERVAGELGITSAIADPTERLTLGPKVAQQSLKRNAPGMMVATGLALRGFD